MEAGVVQYELRIKKLLEKFLEPDFNINNDGYLSSLLRHLSGKNNAEFGEALVSLPIFTEWIIQAIDFWEKIGAQPSQNIISFALNLTGILSKKEAVFLYFVENDVYNRLSKLCSKVQNLSPSIKLAHIKLLNSFLQHCAGIEYITNTNLWEDALNFCLSNQTIYITKEGKTFLYNLLIKVIDQNEVFCNNVVNKIVAPLNENVCKNGITTEINDELLRKNLTATLQLISYILETCVESENFIKEDFRVPALFLRNNYLEQIVSSFLMIAHDQDLLFDLGCVLHSIYFLDLAISAQNKIFTYNEIINTGKNLFSLLSMNIGKGYIHNVLKFCYMGHKYWKIIFPRMPVVETVGDKEPILFENQLIVIQMLPVCFICMKHGNICYTDWEGSVDEFRDNYITKLFKIICEPTIRLIYNWRNIVFLESNIFEHGVKSIAYILKSKEYYQRDRAVLMFQSFMYSLKDIVTAVKQKPQVAEVFTKESAFMTSLLNAIAVFIVDFELTWRESVETICVMGASVDFINIPTWSPRVIVQALKVVNLSIAKFLSPNLALLVDRTSDSALGLLGPMLCTRLHDIDWEVRDSALEVVHTIANISNIKFPSFQKLLLQEKLPTLIITMAMCDSESFVRASALKCLQEMIPVTTLWRSALVSQQLPEKMMHILSNETEAIVRVEAAILMCLIYEHQSISNEIMDSVYETMSNAVVTDLHWEVKIKGLDFWSKVICKHLHNQGMIDGTFPDVTFSKENRKIVTLTESEIKKRLRKVLSQLSLCGCLGVLVMAVQDSFDLEVAKHALQKINRFVGLLNAYNINLSSSVPNSPSENVIFSPTNSNFFNTQKHLTKESADEVINDIVNSKDINLLINVYNSQQKQTSESNTKKNVIIVTPDYFLTFVQRDLNAVVDCRTKWLKDIDDLGSLLDDMLKNSNEDVNNIDCY